MKNTTKTATAAFILALAAGLSAHALDAKVTSVTGKAEYQKAGSDTWTAIQQNDVLSEGTIISTGFNSYVTLNLDGNICTMEPLTRMSIEQISKKDIVQNGKNKTVTKTAVFIDTGKASFKVNSTDKKLNDFKVHSPAATASVRGTEYSVDSNSGTVETSHGLVAVTGGSTRSDINRDSYYIRPEGETSMQTSVKDVGGSDGAIPVGAGESITFTSSSTGERSTPFARRKKNAASLPDSTLTLADQQSYAASAAGISSEQQQGERKTSTTTSSSSSNANNGGTSNVGIGF